MSRVRVPVAVRDCPEWRFPGSHSGANVVGVCDMYSISCFRPFIEERAAVLAITGFLHSKIVLYVGDSKSGDLLTGHGYGPEFAAWQAAGLVVLKRVRRDKTASTTTDSDELDEREICHQALCEELYKEERVITRVWLRRARFYVCGTHRFVGRVTEVLTVMRDRWTRRNEAREGDWAAGKG